MRAGVVIMVGYCRSRLSFIPVAAIVLMRFEGLLRDHCHSRGGTDLISLSVPAVRRVHVHLARAQSQEQFPGNGMRTIELIEHVRL